MSEKIVNLAKLARQASRVLRTSCTHNWVRRRNGVERCAACGDQFPCRKPKCWHVDCWVRRLNLGMIEHYPIRWAMPGLRIADDKGGYVYDTFDDDPTEWTLPTRDTKVEDVT